MGHIAIIMHRSRWGTGVMGHIGNGAHSGCFTEYVNIYLWDAKGEFIVHIFCMKVVMLSCEIS